ncbi:ABC transporter substrate-binding protein [Paenibacillus sp. Leaf72]|nr:ABC transporter substrate-binding protein [Paenibacillus sp. Leaf72]
MGGLVVKASHLSNYRLALILVLACLLLAAGCQGGSAKSLKNATAKQGEKAGDPVTLKVMFFGSEPADMDKILAEFERLTKDTLHIKLDISWDMADTYNQKMKLKMAAGEQIDMLFDASWMNLEQNIGQGYYQPLDDYFQNEKYPGLKQAFPQAVLDANRINGRLYTIPLMSNYADFGTIFIRKDLREKYGLPQIQNMEQFKVFLEKVEQNNPEIIPFGIGNRGFFDMFYNFNDKQTRFRAVPHVIYGTGVEFNLVLSDDGKHVLGATTIGDPDADYAKLPAPFNQSDYFYSHNDKRVEFSRFIPRDVLSNVEDLVVTGKAAAGEGAISGISKIKQRLKAAVPEADLEVFVYNDAARTMQPKAIGTSYKAWNNIVIPIFSRHKEESMKFINWLYESEANHDLFELGIEGLHWNQKGDHMYEMTPYAKDYLFPAYELTLNPLLSRLNADHDEQTLQYLQYQASEDSYYRVALSGFTFNPEPVKIEIAKVQPRYDAFNLITQAGLEPNWREEGSKLNAELRRLGLEKIRAEFIKQVQAYIDSGGH